MPNNQLTELLRDLRDLTKWADVSSLQLLRLSDALSAGGAVVPVRCRDCKYGRPNPFVGNIYCERDGRCSFQMIFQPNDFCSYGERRADGKAENN